MDFLKEFMTKLYIKYNFTLMEYSTLYVFHIKLHVVIHSYGAYGLVVIGLRLVIDKSMVQTKLWSLNVLYCTLIQGTLFTVLVHLAEIRYWLMQS